MAEGIPGHPVTLYPLTAVVGNRDAVDAVSCVLCRGNIRTVLLIGPPGSGKTVVARAAGSVSGDRRIVEVPLNVTAEQAFGTIDLEEAVSSGRRRVSDSLMRRADGNILIADNANLLPKSILHGILDAVLTGRVMAELDGTSVSEDCDTVLVATMDPSEAELSRHELDRFDICVRMEPIDGMDGRLEVLRRSLMHSRDPAGFRSLYEDSEGELRDRISAADPLSVRLPDWAVPAIQGACAAMGADGHRGDISVAETAVTLAALRGLGEADLQCVRDAIRLCLPHRSRHEDADEDVPDITLDIPETVLGEPGQTTVAAPPASTSAPSPEGSGAWSPSMAAPPVPDAQDVVFEIGRTFTVRDFLPEERGLSRDRDSGRRGLMLSRSAEGRCIGYEIPRGRPKDIALGATIRIAAPKQVHRDRGDLAIAIDGDDIREKVRVRRKGAKMLFVVDGSGSMDAERRMVAVKGTILSILEEAYRRRDMVGLVVFKGDEAEEVLPMTRSVLTAYGILKELPIGGRTPLTSGLRLGHDILRRYCVKGEEPVMIVMTDGWGNVNVDPRIRPQEELAATCRVILESPIRPVVIDTEPRGSKFRKAPKLAEMLGAECLLLEEMSADSLSRTVESTLADMETKPRYTR